MFKDWANHWWETLTLDNKANERRSKRLNLGNHLIPFFGNTPVDAITVHQVREFQAQQIRKGLAAATVNNHLRHLGRCLRCAQEDGLIASNPTALVRKQKENTEAWTYLETEEVPVFLEALPEHWRSLFEFAIWIGLRLGEILALRWTDIHWKRGVVQVRGTLYCGEIVTPKTKTSVREVPFQDAVERLLRVQRKAAVQSMFVFPSQTGGPLDPANVRRALNKVNEKNIMGRHIRFHDLRHTFASHCAMAGVPVNTIKDLLGHASITMTMRYAHLGDRAKAEGIETLAAWKKAEEARLEQKVGHILDTPVDSEDSEGATATLVVSHNHK